MPSFLNPRRLALLISLLPGLALAQPSTNYVQRLAALESAVATLTQATLDQKSALAALQTTLASQAGQMALLQDALTAEIAARKAYADAAAATALANARSYSDGQIAPLNDKLVHFSRSGNNVFITGANVYVRNGLGATLSSVNGLGNLIVGYNEGRNQGTANPDVRTGSHNLIVGIGANFSHTGAIVTGINNSSGGHFASVYGGTGNTASGIYSAVLGGYNNLTSGGWATILGGRDRTAAAQLDRLP